MTAPILIPLAEVFDAAHRWLSIHHPELVGHKVRFWTVPEGLMAEVIETKDEDAPP